ncbi:hypothetical protein GA0074704_5287 [Micromonospora siamensis]|uniref:Uncharacterized protein n=1 Tax=Micromonospora siamensis TaxID=299152 RepID=A0A1C5K0B3_9ACTN|nr:hypothetical protein GA0074704_5287 [Micromonospora siamensis]
MFGLGRRSRPPGPAFHARLPSCGRRKFPRGAPDAAANVRGMFTHALIDVAAAPAARGLLLVARPRTRRPALAGRDAQRA